MKTQTIFMILFATTVAAKPITPFKVWYYYNEEGVSTCSEPYEDMACTSEMHVVGTKEYYPYSIWYTFEKNDKEMNYTLWYKFNNTDTVLLDKGACNTEFHDTLIHKKIQSYKFNVNFHQTCSYNYKTDTITNFNIYQETFVNDILQSNFSLASFIDWTYVEYLPIDFDNLQYPIMEMKYSAPVYDECIFCK